MSQERQEQSLEEILASIKTVIAKDARIPRAPRPTPLPPGNAPPEAANRDPADDVLELTETVDDGGTPSAEPPLIDDSRAASMRESIAILAQLSSGAPPAPESRTDPNPLEAMVREMLRPMLADWLDRNLPALIEQMVAREIARITGRKP